MHSQTNGGDVDTSGHKEKKKKKKDKKKEEVWMKYNTQMVNDILIETKRFNMNLHNWCGVH